MSARPRRLLLERISRRQALGRALTLSAGAGLALAACGGGKESGAGALTGQAREADMSRAQRHFASGMNCAQSVLLAVCEELSLSSDAVMKAAIPFGRGIGGSGEICGALAGALMAIGVKEGESATKDRVYGLARETVARFRQEMGNTDCRDLTGLDLGTQEGLDRLAQSGIRETVCVRAVGYAYRTALELLEG